LKQNYLLIYLQKNGSTFNNIALTNVIAIENTFSFNNCQCVISMLLSLYTQLLEIQSDTCIIIKGITAGEN